MLVQVLVDNPSSWIVEYSRELVKVIEEKFGFEARLLHKPDDVIKGDVLCLLSCENIFKKLYYNKYNLVVHESNLPEGKGWSPLTWQILEGKNKIPITLFEATDSVDAGDIYLKDEIYLNGHELIDEIKRKQGLKTIDLIVSFLSKINEISGVPQIGTETFYKRRGKEHSELDVDKTIREQFNHLRVCDNERYPAYFIHNGVKYVVKIFNEEN